MRGGAPRPALVGGVLPVRASPRVDVAHGTTLLFSPGNWRQPDDAAEPARPPRSRPAMFWSWAAVVLLIAALVLPFSVAALGDLVRYLGG